MRKLLLLLLLLPFIASATDYYVKTGGSDAANGLSDATAWATISKVNGFTFISGDRVLFKRGDSFYGTLTVNRSNITFESYGSGAKSIVTGFTTISGWTNEGGGIYSKIITSDAQTNMVTIDGGQVGMGRYPDLSAGYLTYESFVGHTSITDNTLPGTPNWTGAEAAIRKQDWIIDRCPIISQSGGTLTYTSPVGSSEDAKANYGFFIQNDLRTLTVYGEWYHNAGTGKFYMYFGGVDPTTKVVQVATKNKLFYNGNYDNVTVNNMAFIGAIDMGMSYQYYEDNCVISGCDVNFIGNIGIEFLSGCTGTSITNNTIMNCNKTGIRSNTYVVNVSTNNVIANNNIRDIEIIVGQNPTSQTCEGIYVDGNGSQVYYNNIRNIGYNGITVRGEGNPYVHHNFIDSVCTVLDDGGGIYTAGPPINGGTRVFDYNIITNIIGQTAGKNAGSSPYSAGIYLDETATTVTVTNNTVGYNNFAGIKLHKAHDNTITDNTTYSMLYGFNCEDYVGNQIRNNSLRRNIFFARSSNQLAVRWYTVTNDISLFGVADSNYYERPIDDNLTFYLRQLSTGYIYQNLAQWKAFSGQDANSQKAPKSITNVNELDFQYNATASPVIYSFSGFRKMSPQGINYNNSYTIPAYGSVILIANGTTVNALPTANAGANQSITLPTNSTTLAGSGTDPDGTIVSYSWAKVSGPATGSIISPTSATTGINNLVQGVYQFALTVTDNLGASGKDTVQVTVNAAPNVPPTANAGASQNITLPISSTTLVGSGTDTDGTIVGYAWTKDSGPACTITSPSSATTGVTGLTAGIYVFRLTVTDNLSLTGFDTMRVFVTATPNVPPTANAGSNQVTTLPINTVTLTGSGTDVDGIIVSYLWTKIVGGTGGTIASPASSTTSINTLLAGVYQYELTVTDNLGLTGKDTVQITVNSAANIPPVANAGANQTITLPTNTATLVGSGTDVDGTIVSYQWLKLAGSPAGSNFTVSTNPTLPLTNLIQGVYQFSLTVTDNNGGVGKDTVQVTVNPSPNVNPVVTITVPALTITLPTSSATLAGTATDSDGTITSYLWSKVTGPATYTIVTVNSNSTTVNNLVQGTYQFLLTATDNLGATGSGVMTINVLPNPTPVTTTIVYLYNWIFN